MNILINRTDAIGDTLLTLPMAQVLKKHKENCRVIILLSMKCKGLVNSDSFVDEVVYLNHQYSWPKKFWFLFRLFRKQQINTYIYVGGSNLVTFVSWLKRVPLRMGLKSRWPTFLFLNQGTRQKRSLVEMHELEYNLNLLTPLGIKIDSKSRQELQFPLHCDQGDKERVKSEVESECQKLSLEFKSRWLIVHPGMSGTHTLNWSARNYARFISRFEKKNPDEYLYIVTHTPGDKKYFKVFWDELQRPENDLVRKKVYLLDGSIKGLSHTLAILSNAQLLIGPSTGPLHMANALGIRTLGIFSPIKIQSAKRWGPAYGRDSIAKVITPDVVCGESLKCAGESCPYYECMAKIEVDEVVSVSTDLLKKG